MGTFNIVYTKDGDGLQYKVGGLFGRDYDIGDKIAIADGVYLCFEGAFVVKDSIVVAAFPEKEIFDKWGARFDLDKINS